MLTAFDPVPTGIRILPGIEFSSQHEQHDAYLAYGFVIDNPGLNELMEFILWAGGASRSDVGKTEMGMICWKRWLPYLAAGN